MTYEEAMEAVNLKKTALKEAKAALRGFRKENDINPDEEIADAKLAKKHGKLVAAVTEAETALEEVSTAAKELKPKAERAVKYEYPEGMTAAEKKKFRAKARAAAKKEAKGEATDEKPVKKAKAEAAAEEAPAADAKPKKKKAPVEEED
jgi:hypothetical protein